MFAESTDFQTRLKQCEKQIKTLKKATDGIVVLSEKVLSGPMPRVWENNEAGEAFPVATTGKPLSLPGRLRRSNSQDMAKEVYDPIGDWHREYDRIKARMPELQKASLRVDAARRQHYKDTQKHLKDNVMKQDSGYLAPPTESAILTGSRAAYQTVEEQVHKDLMALAERARDVQRFLTNAMTLQADKLADAASTHSPTASKAEVPQGFAADKPPQTTTESFPSAPQHPIHAQPSSAQQQPTGLKAKLQAV